jgi:DegV family protein with EDD domain
MTKNFGIMTDSGADFSLEYMNKHDLILIPTRIMVDDVEYIDRENITREEIIDKMINEKAKTSTSVAPPAEFHRIISESLEKYEKVMYIAISAKMSATYQNAILTAKKIAPDRFIAIDTLSVSWGMTQLIDHAILRRDQGIPIEKVAEEIEQMKETISIFFIVETLEYLRRGGRIGAAKSLLGKIAGVKPILSLADGQIISHSTVKSYEEGMDFFMNQLEEFTATNENYTLAILYGIDSPEFQNFSDNIKKKFKPLKFLHEPIGANIISHAGPYLYGLSILKIPEEAIDAYK